MSKPFITYYDVLGVPQTATAADIKSAYFSRFSELNKMYFGDNDSCVMDDRYYSASATKERQFFARLLQRAYTVLRDPVQRQRYDRYIVSLQQPQSLDPVSLFGGGRPTFSFPQLVSLLTSAVTLPPQRKSNSTEVLSSALSTYQPTNEESTEVQQPEGHQAETASPQRYVSRRQYPDGTVEVVECYAYSNVNELPERLRILSEQLMSAAL